MLLSALLSLLPLTTAHFVLTWPPNRGFADDTASTFPCGGFNEVKTPRTEWPINGGPIQLRMQHTQTRVKVFLGLGDDPGTNYNVTLRPMFTQEGLGNFCIGGLSVEGIEGVEVQDGTNATLQVVTNGDPEGGLFQCADVVLVSKFLSEADYNQHCNNGTIKITGENLPGNPNETTRGEPEPSSTGEGTVPATPTGGLPGRYTAASWALGVVGAVGFVML